MTIYALGFIVYYFQIGIYVILISRSLSKHNKNIMEYFSYHEHISLTWLKVLIFIIIINAIFEIFVALSFFARIFHILEILYYLIFLFIVSFLGYFGLKQNDIYVNADTNNNNDAPIENNLEHIQKNDLKENRVLTDDELHSIAKKITVIMEKEQLYLNPQLSIYDIANQLHTNKTYVSMAINTIHGKNFRNFVNHYRIQKGIDYLIDSRYDNLSLDAIAENIGFTSKATFTNAFCKIHNTTPADYRKQRKFED
jgi:AraC-like DNA-binding protein